MEDMQLMRLYTERGSQEAFGTLVNRYIDLVYSAAHRQVRDPGLAEDVTQAVFIILTHKARLLGDGTILSTWLLMTTHYAVKNAQRAQYRRRYHETRAAEMSTTVQRPEEDANWEAVAPLIDDAISRLRGKDRAALVLRFWEGKSLRDIGLVFGISENAAGKRVAHALTKLRGVLSDRGVASSLVGLGVVLASHTVQAAPPGVRRCVAAVIAGTGMSAQSLAIADGTMRLMAGTTRMTAASVASVVMIVVGLLLALQMPRAETKSLAVVSTQPTTVPATQPNWEAWVIRPGEGIGPIRLGMTVEQVRALAGDPDRITGTAYEYLAKGFAIGFRQQAGLRVANILAGDASGNSTLIGAFKPRTAEGLGMGSTVEQITAAYGNPDELRVNPGIKSALVQTLSYRNRGIELVARNGRVVWLSVRMFGGGGPGGFGATAGGVGAGQAP